MKKRKGSKEAAVPAPPIVRKPPSALALATAASMRRFDSRLTDEQLDIIARGIDAAALVGTHLNPKERRLRNCDEPITRLTVPLT